MRLLVTGAAGFIGMHACKRLLERGHQILGIDNLNAYYDPALKRARLEQLRPFPAFSFEKVDIADERALAAVFEPGRFDAVLHLAAQAGVRYSLENPMAYVSSNVAGFLNILEGCRHNAVAHCVFASSSSVYGANTTMPFRTGDPVDHPLSLYAATKKANELMAHSYASLYGTPMTGLRFFTVYGPWGRPDMALFLFTKAILEGRAIDVFNHGKMIRDFTYVDDIAEGVVRTLDRIATAGEGYDPAAPDPARSNVPYRVFNIGNQAPVPLMSFIEAIEQALGRTAQKNFLPLQDGDVPATHADVSELERWTGFVPGTPVPEGVRRFVAWYRDYFKV